MGQEAFSLSWFNSVDLSGFSGLTTIGDMVFEIAII